MKKVYFLLALVSFFTINSCKKNKEKLPPPTPVEVKLLSFGFYENDNKGIIFNDYVDSNITSKSISLLLPKEIDKSALVARFKTSKNEVVKVNGVTQVSGETKNNFNNPVDFVLSLENTNAIYTVTVGKAPDYVWKKINTEYSDSMNLLLMKVNPANNNPYFMYNQYKTSSTDQRPAVASFDGNIWTSLGTVSNMRMGSYFDMTFNSAGVPYISFADYEASVSQANSVKKHTGGTSWSYVGTNAATTAKVSYNALSFVNDNKILLFSHFDATSGPLARRELDMSVFENNSWTTNLTMPGRPSALYAYLPIAIQKKDTVYLGVMNPVAPYTVSIYKYFNNTWNTLADLWVASGTTGINIRDMAMDVDKEGNVYLAFADNATGVYAHRVIKYDAKSKTAATLGDIIPAASGNLFNFDLAVSPTGTPYFFYRNGSNFPTIISFDRETQTWTTPQVFESEVAEELNIDFTSKGEAYLSYLKNRKIILFKYSTP